VIKLRKKTKEALIGYLNNASGLYSLYEQDSWSDEDFLTAAVTDWTLDIMEGCIYDMDVRPAINFIRKVINEGRRVMEHPHDDDEESDDIATYDELMAEAERLKAKIGAIPVKKEIRPLGRDKNGKERSIEG
jgi:hypothetical protein